MTFDCTYDYILPPREVKGVFYVKKKKGSRQKHFVFLHATTTKLTTMGYASLEPHLPSSHAPLLPPGTLLSISDTQASDGNFLLHHFISNYIKADQNVVLVGLAGILVHYTMVGRKLVSNLAYKST